MKLGIYDAIGAGARTADEVAASVPERHYDLAGSLLASAITEADRTGEPVAECLTEAARSGASAVQLQLLGGWTSLKMAQQYVHLTGRDVVEAAARVSEAMRRQASAQASTAPEQSSSSSPGE